MNDEIDIFDTQEMAEELWYLKCHVDYNILDVKSYCMLLSVHRHNLEQMFIQAQMAENTYEAMYAQEEFDLLDTLLHQIKEAERKIKKEHRK